MRQIEILVDDPDLGEKIKLAIANRSSIKLIDGKGETVALVASEEQLRAISRIPERFIRQLTKEERIQHSVAALDVFGSITADQFMEKFEDRLKKR